MTDHKADFIFCNARVITFDKTNPRAEFVAVKGNRIIGAGSSFDIDSYADYHTKRIDCQGMTILPGFNDAHCHPVSHAIMQVQVDCSPAAVNSISDIKQAFRRKRTTNQKSLWLRGAQYNETHLTEKRHPNRWDLDEAASDMPIVLVHYTGGICVLNTKALQLIGITKNTANTSAGQIGRHGESGEPNGIIYGLVDQVQKNLPAISVEELMAGMRLAGQQYLSYGITSLQDTGWNNSVSHWETYQSMKATDGLLPCRVSMLFGVNALDDAVNKGVSMGCGTDQLRIGGVKIALDESTGNKAPSREELEQVAQKVLGMGFQPAFHVSDIYNLRNTLSVIDSVSKGNSQTVKRFRLEHCFLCTPDLTDALKKSCATVITQPAVLFYQGGDFLKTVPVNSLHYVFPLLTYLQSGIPMAFSSDTPLMPVNPFIGIYAAVTRKELYGKTLAVEEAISVTQALSMYTAMGAFSSMEEDLKGTITAGKLADFIVLNSDPITADKDELQDIAVMMTIIDGKIVWEYSSARP